MQTLNAIYLSRTAMISLADGSAENPQVAYQEMQAAAKPLATFGDRIEQLERSFNDSDYMHFWDTLSSFGSIYQFNAAALNSSRLRELEHSLRSFENDVVDLNRQYSEYLDLYQELMNRLGDETSIQEVQQHVPLVNSITQKTVQLDALIKDFSESLFNISRKLRSVQNSGHFG